jgi:hypothetical protein
MKKFLVIILFTAIISCSDPLGESQSNTEIYCPRTGHKALILYATREEVSASIVKAFRKEERVRENNRYSVLEFSGGRKTSINNIEPRQLFYDCLVREMARKPNVPLDR